MRRATLDTLPSREAMRAPHRIRKVREAPPRRGRRRAPSYRAPDTRAP